MLGVDRGGSGHRRYSERDLACESPDSYLSSPCPAVREVRDGEALIDTDDRHLRFVAGVQADDHLLHVTTVVQLKGWRGQLYFLPVRFLHDQITRSMMTAAVRRASAAGER